MPCVDLFQSVICFCFVTGIDNIENRCLFYFRIEIEDKKSANTIHPTDVGSSPAFSSYY